MTGFKLLMFTDKPSALYTLWQAFINRNSKLTPKEKITEIRVKRTGLRVDVKHLADFHDICGIPQLEYLHILYPFALAYPYMMRILCRREMPFSMFKILNTRNSIIMYRRIRPDEVIDIDCRNSEIRIVSKGIEVDIVSEVSTGRDKVWENTTTYFVRGKQDDMNMTFIPPRLDPIMNAQTIKDWHLPARDRFRFARISGDTNGIHYWAFYARMLGFKRDFAQPIRIVTHCVSSLPFPGLETPQRLDFFLKGPVYYESTLVLKTQTVTGGCRFNLYCKSTDKPRIEGKLIRLPA